MEKSASWFSTDHYEISFISVQIDFAAFLKDDERQADLTLKLRPLGVAVIRGQRGQTVGELPQSLARKTV